MELLTPKEMTAADAAAVAAGTPGIALMEAAGRAVADVVEEGFPAAHCVVVACGPGNNGGDGFIAARLLAERGRAVSVALLGGRDALKGDAAAAAARWSGATAPFAPALLDGCDLVVDALFGAGLGRDLDGPARAAVEAINAAGKPVVAVDLPSGVDGATGAVRGAAIRAAATVTFFRLKPGHMLLPGRALCGRRVLAPIGIGEGVLAAIGPRGFANRPALWRRDFPVPAPEGHKYVRGHAVIAAGVWSAGAPRLSARGALRAGAGLVTLASPPALFPVHAAALDAVIVQSVDGEAGLRDLLADRRKNAVLVGPGAGVGAATAAMVRAALGPGRAVVLDADALTSFADEPAALFAAIARAGTVVVTPHEGEFQRLFGALEAVKAADGKLARARAAAAASGAVVLLKGADTVVAAPDGRAAIADNAPPWLATAGTGDVLAGMATGLVAQGMPAFDAAAAAVWLHGEAAAAFGPGLIAEDLPAMLPQILASLFAGWGVLAKREDPLKLK
ncbi:MAG TPA: NAD(P)H-hydrate dehydratase [Hyphomicrobiales bacterium]|nr:NAD(P)H-hydrate dehydratase [Hyphomicrobiales bacterium]